VTEPIQVIPMGEPELPAEIVTERKLEEIIQGSRVIRARHQGFTKAIARKLLDVMEDNVKLREALKDYRSEHRHNGGASGSKCTTFYRCHLCRIADALLEGK
jgi:hypothetical protein